MRLRNRLKLCTPKLTRFKTLILLFIPSILPLGYPNPMAFSMLVLHSVMVFRVFFYILTSIPDFRQSVEKGGGFSARTDFSSKPGYPRTITDTPSGIATILGSVFPSSCFACARASSMLWAGIMCICFTIRSSTEDM